MVDIAASNENLNALFAPAAEKGLEQDVSLVLESILRLYDLSAQELFYKWESYCLKMSGGIGTEDGDVRLDLQTARMFSKDVNNEFERGHQNAHGKSAGRGSEKKSGAVHATPRAGSSGDVFGMLDGLTPNTISKRTGSVKRKSDFSSPAARKISRPESTAQKKGSTDGVQSVTFSQRTNAGQVIENINDHLPRAEPPIAPFAEARVKPVANMDIKKFAYKPMSMRLTESSEVLDERIDQFAALVQKHHQLEDSAFGNAASQSTDEIVAVGRIACDTSEGKLNPASIVLETSRRTGAGLRVTLKIDTLRQYQFFPGQIVAVRGTNASGMYFTVSEVLEVPQLPMASSAPATIEAINTRIGVSDDSNGSPLNIIFGSGPYTTDDNLDFEALEALCTKAMEEMADAMVLSGPFLDIEHPLIVNGDIDLPDIKGMSEATMSTVFKLRISSKLEQVCLAVPSITIILVPSLRDATSKHVSWPQEQLSKKDLGLPKQVRMLPNPGFISFNEVLIAVSSQDILFELSREQIASGTDVDLLTRLPKYLIDQRHFFPLYPPMPREKLPSGSVTPTGTLLDLGYLKLGEWLQVKPDILFLPSVLTPSVKVVDSVMVINAGTLSKRKAAGTFAQMSLQPRVLSDEDREKKHIPHNVFDRARVDVIRI